MTEHKRKKAAYGFTLVELLVVMGIIGILSTIALPAFMGQREKAKVRAVEAAAKGALPEIQGLVDSLNSSDPFIVLASDGSEVCIQDATAARMTCDAVFGVPNSGTYSDLNSILNYVVNHHRGRGDRSPFNTTTDLFVTGSGETAGRIVLEAQGPTTVNIRAYATDDNSPIFDSLVVAR